MTNFLKGIKLLQSIQPDHTDEMATGHDEIYTPFAIHPDQIFPPYLLELKALSGWYYDEYHECWTYSP